jgi:hypothetical protein
VIGTGADDDEVSPLRLLAVGGPLAGESDDGLPIDARQVLLPRRRVGSRFVVARGVVTGEPSIDAELRHEQIEDRRDRDATVPGLDITDGHAAPLDGITGEVVELELDHAVVPVEE